MKVIEVVEIHHGSLARMRSLTPTGRARDAPLPDGWLCQMGGSSTGRPNRKKKYKR